MFHHLGVEREAWSFPSCAPCPSPSAASTPTTPGRCRCASSTSAFRAAERREGDPTRPELPWIELARGGCETVITADNHETMHEPPAVEEMAGELRRRLDLAADPRARKPWQGARR